MSKKISIKSPDLLRAQKVDEILDNWVANTQIEKMDKKIYSRLNVNIPTELHVKLKMHCAQNKINITDLITKLLIGVIQ